MRPRGSPSRRIPIVLLGLALGAVGCTTGTGSVADLATPTDGGNPVTGCTPAPAAESLVGCAPTPTDFLPAPGPSDAWPACVSDDGAFHLVGASTPASAARAMAFEAMGARLWGKGAAPTAADFLAARDAYSVAEGIGSRVERRQDVHYPEVPGGNKFACADPGVPQAYPDRCAGPGRLVPIINDAFQRGLALDRPEVQAARLEAALLWFFYLSTLSEIWTCGFDDVTDCDSVYGYYSGAQPPDRPLGLARAIAALSPETHLRAFAGVLAVRCWRDLDRALPSGDATREADAARQLDRAELRGLARIARHRLARLACSTGETRDAAHAFLGVLGGFLDREAHARIPAAAERLAAELAKAPAAVDVAAAQAALDALFPCP